MLEKYAALKLKSEAKKALKKQILADLEAEFGDVDKELEAERAKIKQWMKDNDMTFHMDEDGIVEVRRSAPKYDVVNDKNLIRWLYDNGYLDSLNFIKSDVNALAKLGQIPDNIVNIIVTDDELTVRLNDK